MAVPPSAMPKKRAKSAISLKSFASEMEGTTGIATAMDILTRMGDAVRATGEKVDMSRNLGHFSDWLFESRARGGRLETEKLEAFEALIQLLDEESALPLSEHDRKRIRDDLRACADR